MDELSHLHPHGLFLRHEALDFGYDDRDLVAAMADGAIVRVRHGTYVDAAVWAAATPQERFNLRGRAVLMRHPGRVALSHTSGAAALGLRLWDADLRRVHVTRLGDGHAGSHGDVVYHADDSSTRDVHWHDGIPVVAPVRSALGAAALQSIEAGVVVLDSLIDRGLASMEDLHAAYCEISGAPGTRKLNITVRLVEPGAQSVGESRTRFLCWRAGLPKPVLQFEVRDHHGRLVGITDFAWPEHRLLGEFDGKIKYLRLLKDGERPEDVVVREKVREDELREVTGFGMIRFIWIDLGRPHLTGERLRRQLWTPRAA